MKWRSDCCINGHFVDNTTEKHVSIVGLTSVRLGQSSNVCACVVGRVYGRQLSIGIENLVVVAFAKLLKELHFRLHVGQRVDHFAIAFSNFNAVNVGGTIPKQKGLCLFVCGLEIFRPEVECPDYFPVFFHMLIYLR